MEKPPATDNLAADLIARAERIAGGIVRANPHVAGILLTGGLARGFGDRMSDIDLDVFFHEAELKNPASHQGIANHTLPEGNFVEFGRRSLEQWMLRRNEPWIWTMENRWDKTHAKILYDPRSELARMLKIKLVFRRDERRRLQYQARINSLWLGGEVATSWIKRGDLTAAHHSLNRGVELLLDYLFLKNARFIPHAKWKYFLARQLPTLPDRFAERIEEVLLIKELSAEDLKRRQATFRPLAREAQRLPDTRPAAVPRVAIQDGLP